MTACLFNRCGGAEASAMDTTALPDQSPKGRFRYATVPSACFVEAAPAPALPQPLGC